MNRSSDIWIDKNGKNQDKSINETNVSSISTDWLIQSISIKSDLSIFIDLFIDCQIDTDFYRWTTPGFKFPKRNKALLIYIKNITQFDIFDLDSTFYQYFPGKDYLVPYYLFITIFSVAFWHSQPSSYQSECGERNPVHTKTLGQISYS